MGPYVEIRYGVYSAPTSSYLFPVRVDGGESGSKVFEGLDERGDRVANEKGDELHPSPVILESRVKEGVRWSIINDIFVAAEVSIKSDLEKNEGTLLRVKLGRVRRGVCSTSPA